MLVRVFGGPNREAEEESIARMAFLRGTSAGYHPPKELPPVPQALGLERLAQAALPILERFSSR